MKHFGLWTTLARGDMLGKQIMLLGYFDRTPSKWN